MRVLAEVALIGAAACGFNDAEDFDAEGEGDMDGFMGYLVVNFCLCIDGLELVVF